MNYRQRRKERNPGQRQQKYFQLNYKRKYSKSGELSTENQKIYTKHYIVPEK